MHPDLPLMVPWTVLWLLMGFVGLGLAVWLRPKSPSTPEGNLSILGRMGLGPRRSLLVVRLGSRAVLVGSSEAGFHRLESVPLETLGLGLEAPPSDPHRLGVRALESSPRRRPSRRPTWLRKARKPGPLPQGNAMREPTHPERSIEDSPSRMGPRPLCFTVGPFRASLGRREGP